MKIMIAIPAYRGSIKSGCVTSLFEIVNSLHAKGIACSFMTTDAPDISTVRNLIASRFLARSETHLLQIDDDITCRASTVIKMITADRPVIGCVYPYKNHNKQFVVWNEHKEYNIVDGMADVSGVGMGLCLIRRDALVELSKSVRTYKRPEEDRTLYGFFDRIPPLSEDYSYFKRWRDAGGRVVGLFDEDIGHIGQYTYRGKFSDSHPKPPSSPG